jgi:hypothetical protein
VAPRNRTATATRPPIIKMEPPTNMAAFPISFFMRIDYRISRQAASRKLLPTGWPEVICLVFFCRSGCCSLLPATGIE